MAAMQSEFYSRVDAPSILRALIRGKDLELHDSVWSEIFRAAKALKLYDAASTQKIISAISPADDVQSFAHLLIRLRVAFYLEDFAESESIVDDLQRHPMMNEPSAAALANFRIAISLGERSRHEDAVKLYLDAAATFRELCWGFEEALCVVEIGHVMRAKGDVAGAMRCYLSVIDTIQREGDEDNYAGMLLNLASALHVSGNTEEAERRFTQVLQTSRFSRPGLQRAEILVRMAFLHKSAGRIEAAHECYMEALAMTDNQQPSVMSARIESNLAELDVMRAEYASALARIDKARSMCLTDLPLLIAVQMHGVRARALMKLGSEREAAETLTIAMSLASEKGDIELYHIVLKDALEWVEEPSQRLHILEEYRIVQDERMKSIAKSTAAMLDLRVSFEQEQSRREIARQKDLANAVAETQQLTMNDIGRDLHDSIGQDVTVLSMLVDRLRATPSIANDEVIGILETMQTVTHRLAVDSRRIAHRLMSKTVAAQNLLEALAELNTELSVAAPSLRIELHHSGSIEAMTDEVALTLYRIVQATVKNVVRHAEASMCTINLVAHDDHFHLAIEDDGKGFDPRSVTNGIGLRETKARAELVGAKVRIESHPGSGTYVEVVVPRR